MQPPPVFYYFCPSFIDIWPTIKILGSLPLFKQTDKQAKIDFKDENGWVVVVIII